MDVYNYMMLLPLRLQGTDSRVKIYSDYYNYALSDTFYTDSSMTSVNETDTYFTLIEMDHEAADKKFISGRRREINNGT